MPPLIKSVSPYRAKIGDVITILGGGFSPTPGQNKVMIAGAQATVLSESEYQLTAVLPVTLASSQFAYVMVKRGDTQEVGDGFGVLWVMPPVEISRFTPIPGQVPGSPLERNDLSAEAPDVPLAKDYERYASVAEAVQSLISLRGELLTSTGGSASTVGAVGSGMILEARSQEATGLRWVSPARRITYSWGALVTTNDGFLAANGTGASTLGSGDWHGIPVQSEIVNLTVFVQELVSPGTAIDQVILYKNGSAIITSGASLQLEAGNSATFNVSLNVVPGDVLTVYVNPGPIYPATGSPSGSVRVLVSVLTKERCNSKSADIIDTMDSVSTLITGSHLRSLPDAVSTSDSVSVQ